MKSSRNLYSSLMSEEVGDAYKNANDTNEMASILKYRNE